VIDSDLAATLRAVGAQVDDNAPVVDAGFFHRTLARWLGLPEGRSSARAPVQWEYGFWKATFEPQAKGAGAVNDAGDSADDGRDLFAADLSRTRDGPIERVMWFVKKDARGRITEAGWLSAPPQLIDAPASGATDEAPTLDDATLARLLDDDTEAG